MESRKKWGLLEIFLPIYSQGYFIGFFTYVQWPSAAKSGKTVEYLTKYIPNILEVKTF